MITFILLFFIFFIFCILIYYTYSNIIENKKEEDKEEDKEKKEEKEEDKEKEEEKEEEKEKNKEIIKILTQDSNLVTKSLKKLEILKKIIKNQSSLMKLYEINKMIPDDIFKLDPIIEQINDVINTNDTLNILNVFKTEDDIEITDYHYKLGNFILPLYK